MAIDTVLRQWCDTCQAITRTWMDGRGDLLCSTCDPEDPRHPGWSRSAIQSYEW